MFGSVDVRRHRFVVLLVLSISLLLASCSGPGSGSGPGGPDPDIFTADRVFGGPAPGGAVMFDPAAFEALVDDDGFRWEGATLRMQREAEAHAKLAADLEILEATLPAALPVKG